MSRSQADEILERAVAQARQLTVGAGEAERWARETIRWGRAAEAEKRRSAVWWAVPALALGAAAALAVLWSRGDTGAPAAAETITDVGDHVAVAPGPGARFAVVASSPSQTEIRVAAGRLTARLYRGEGPHRLIVAARDMRFEATGTVYTVVVPESGAPFAIVHEGTVDAVDDRGGRQPIAAGATWPAHSRADRAASERAAVELGRHAAPGRAARREAPARAPTAPVAPIGSATPTAPASPAVGPTPADAGAAAPRPGPAPSLESAEDTWRRGRLLRGQGRYREALHALAPLAAGRDPTWAPIAHLERMRILETMSDPRAVRDLGAEFRARWPTHALIGEATALFCAAHRQMNAPVPEACRGVQP